MSTDSAPDPAPADGPSTPADLETALGNLSDAIEVLAIKSAARQAAGDALSQSQAAAPTRRRPSGRRANGCRHGVCPGGAIAQ